MYLNNVSRLLFSFMYSFSLEIIAYCVPALFLDTYTYIKKYFKIHLFELFLQIYELLQPLIY